MQPQVNVAILGATGAVGQRFIQLLENHPWFNVTEVVASERSAGKRYMDAVNWVLDGLPPKNVQDLTVKALTDALDAPLVFSALPSSAAREIEEQLATAGHVVCSNASAHRMDEDVPLMIPEVNADHVALIDIQRRNRGWTTGALITNSNCTSMPVTMALAPLRHFDLTHMHVVSMQAISGAGYPGVSSFDILDNVVPYIKNEEEKLGIEPAKMLGTLQGDSIAPYQFNGSAACNRVPVIDSHLVSVAARFATNPSVEDIINAWQTFTPPADVQDLPSAPPNMVEYISLPDRPQPRRDRNAGNGMTTTVGRLREWPLMEGGVQFLALSHNTIRGAAGCSILNAELLLKKGYIQGVGLQELAHG